MKRIFILYFPFLLSLVLVALCNSITPKERIGYTFDRIDVHHENKSRKKNVRNYAFFAQQYAG